MPDGEPERLGADPGEERGDEPEREQAGQTDGGAARGGRLLARRPAHGGELLAGALGRGRSDVHPSRTVRSPAGRRCVRPGPDPAGPGRHGPGPRGRGRAATARTAAGRAPGPPSVFPVRGSGSPWNGSEQIRDGRFPLGLPARVAGLVGLLVALGVDSARDRPGRDPAPSARSVRCLGGGLRSVPPSRPGRRRRGPRRPRRCAPRPPGAPASPPTSGPPWERVCGGPGSGGPSVAGGLGGLLAEPRGVRVGVRPRVALVTRCFPRLWCVIRHGVHWTTAGADVQGDVGCVGQKGRDRQSVRTTPGPVTTLELMSHVLAAVAWPYANGPRHIGHVSGFGVPSDVFSRYMRMAGHDVLMVSGTDEHGTPIQVQADADGVTPRELADRYNRVIVEDLHGLGLSYDLFTRTTTAQPLRGRAGAVHRPAPTTATSSRKTTLGAISPSTGRTLPDRYIEGTCPICGYDSARGDQCDNCGNQLDPEQLINPRSKINGETPGVRRDRALLPRPARLRRGAGPLARRPRGLAPQRAQVLPQPARRPAAPGHHPGPGVGRADPARRLARPQRQAHLRLVRRGHRLPVRVDRVGPALRRPGGVAAVVVGRRPGQGLARLLLHGQGQHRLPLGDLAGAAAGLLRRAATRAAPRARSARSTCRPRWSPANT